MLAWVGRVVAGRRRSALLRGAATNLDRAQRLRADNRHGEALAVVRDGLQLLSDPAIRRREAADGTVLVGLTTLAEELAQQLGQPGASHQDLVDALAILGRLEEAMTRFPDLTHREPESSKELRARWIPYLRARLADEAK